MVVGVQRRLTRTPCKSSLGSYIQSGKKRSFGNHMECFRPFSALSVPLVACTLEIISKAQYWSKISGSRECDLTI